MAGKCILTEAKKKHHSLCNKLDGLITSDSFERLKRMAMTYLDPKQVEKANSMNELLHQLEIKGVISVGNYDKLIDLMKHAGIEIGIVDIRETTKEIQSKMQSIHVKARVRKMKGKATQAKCQMANNRKSKRKADVKVTSVKKKSISKNPDTNKSSLKEAYQSIASLTLSQIRPKKGSILKELKWRVQQTVVVAKTVDWDCRVCSKPLVTKWSKDDRS